MNLIKNAAKSFLSLFAIMRLLQINTTNILSLILFIAFFYIYSSFSQPAKESRITQGDRIMSGMLSVLFTFFTMAAKYQVMLADMTNTLFCTVILVLSAAGFLILYYYFMLFLFLICPQVRITERLYAAPWLPLTAFVVCLIAWLPYFLHEYPGVMTPDSINQYAQVIGAYQLSNHHSVIHTLLIGFFYNLGMQLTQNPYLAIAFYTLFQMAFMAFAAAYMIASLQKAGVKPPICIAALCFYAFMPYHGVYAVTIWKDILFAGSTAVFTAALLRFLLLNRSDKITLHTFLTAVLPYMISGFLMCLLRSNGWYAFLITLPFLLYTFRESWRLMIPVHAVLLALVLFVKIPCMNIYEIKQPDFVESLSIPVQQLARVVANGETLTQEQLTTLGHFMDTSAVSAAYQPDVSDNIKNLIRASGSEYLEQHKGEFFSLWLRVGLDHPKAYFDAYVDQTNGFWYPDIAYEVALDEGIYPNEFGLTWQPVLKGSLVIKIKEIILKLWQLIPLYGLFWSMGTVLWTILIALCMTIKNGSYRNYILFIPALAIFLTLCIATPVATEFRYAYAVIYTLPLYLIIPFIHKD